MDLIPGIITAFLGGWLTRRLVIALLRSLEEQREVVGAMEASLTKIGADFRAALEGHQRYHGATALVATPGNLEVVIERAAMIDAASVAVLVIDWPAVEATCTCGWVYIPGRT